MKVGDLVRLKNLHPEWGKIGFITRITYSDQRQCGQISLLSNGGHRAVPWYRRDHYLEVINESE